MRLLETFQNAEEASQFLGVLKSQNIEASIEEKAQDGGSANYLIWIFDENDIDKAADLLQKFRENPEALVSQAPPVQSAEPREKGGPGPLKNPIRVKINPRLWAKKNLAPITKSIILLCAVLYFWASYQRSREVNKEFSIPAYFSLSPLDIALMYDVPILFDKFEIFFNEHPEIDPNHMSKAEDDEITKLEKEDPPFRGYYPILISKLGVKRDFGYPKVLFRKIREGQFWRLVTPAVLHGSLLHILFNMLWLWMLGKEVEQKVGRLRYIFISLIVAAVANTAQYLMSGPFFLGYSGVVVGLAGFIFIRQRVAPWEGYGVQKSALIFLGVFVLLMALFQLGTLAMQVIGFDIMGVPIANSAHIIGGLCGMLLARIPQLSKVKT